MPVLEAVKSQKGGGGGGGGEAAGSPTVLLYPHKDVPIPSALYAPLNVLGRNSGRSPRDAVRPTII